MAALCLLALVGGCNRFRHQHQETVYVSVGKIFLRNRVAPVAKRVAQVVNGQPLEVIERRSRFLKVKTEKNQVGWIDDREVIGEKTYEAFIQLATQHKGDPVETEATLRDELYMHLQPGRETEHFYLLPDKNKVELLERASVARTFEPAYAPLARLAEPKPTRESSGRRPAAHGAGGRMEQPAPVMEDWWLARDLQGHVGWLLGSRLDIDVPEAIEAYGGGQRFVGAWPLVQLTNPKAVTPSQKLSEYVAALAPYKAGLPYDFDQVRVFTWSVHRHRYETAFLLHSIKGFLPVQLTTASTPHGNVPVFSFKIAGSQGVTTDSGTGISRPVNPRTLRYELIKTRVRRIGPDLAPIITRHKEHKRTQTRRN